MRASYCGRKRLKFVGFYGFFKRFRLTNNVVGLGNVPEAGINLCKGFYRQKGVWRGVLSMQRRFEGKLTCSKGGIGWNRFTKVA